MRLSRFCSTSDGVSDSLRVMLHHEGHVTFQVGTAFYRPHSRLARDLGVLAAAVHRQDVGRLRVLDGMAGCGVRSLRYLHESGADDIWANDSNSDVLAVLTENLAEAIASGHAQVTHWDANRVFFDCYQRGTFYDLVDVDAFGSPAPYLGSSLWAVAIGGLLYLTSTDGRTLTGHDSTHGLASYGAYPRHHPAAHEQGLRVVTGNAMQLAAAKGLGATVLFSLFSGEIYRVMLRLVAHSPLTPHTYGWLGYCRACGNYRTVSWRKLGAVVCPCGGTLSLSGPMWLGTLHDRPFLQRMITLAQERHWFDQVKLLQVMATEADFPPYFLTLREIGRRGKLDLPGRSRLVEALHARGYRACATHINPQSLKTDATLQSCVEAANAIPKGEI